MYIIPPRNVRMFKKDLVYLPGLDIRKLTKKEVTNLSQKLDRNKNKIQRGCIILRFINIYNEA